MCSMAYSGSDALRALFSGFGLSLRCSRLNVGKRWLVKPIGDGAYRYAPGKGWAVVVDAIRALTRFHPPAGLHLALRHRDGAGPCHSARLQGGS